VLRSHCRDVGRDPSEITTTRLGTLVLTPNADETARVSEFLRGVAGDGFGEQFTVGQEPDVLEQVGALVDAGVDELIFNLPMSDVATVQRAGELLSGRFG
jgi:hypothetical protein